MIKKRGIKKSYDKMRKVRYKISRKELIRKYRKEDKNFTRERKIKFRDVVYFTLNKRDLSLKNGNKIIIYSLLDFYVMKNQLSTESR